MDTQWYAVDGKGNVAVFQTGAGGAVPGEAYSPDEADMLEEMGIDDAEPPIDAARMPDERRLFVYETGPLDECLSERYHRSKKPKKPVHIDELPPDVRETVGRVRFDGLDFTKDAIIQPIELTECGSWDPAYLASDGKTVKPVPGREREYREFIKEYRDDFTEDELTFEEPKPARPKKAPKSGKKKKSKGDG
jgi:hypothetical protein